MVLFKSEKGEKLELDEKFTFQYGSIQMHFHIDIISLNLHLHSNMVLFKSAAVQHLHVLFFHLHSNMVLFK